MKYYWICFGWFDAGGPPVPEFLFSSSDAAYKYIDGNAADRVRRFVERVEFFA